MSMINPSKLIPFLLINLLGFFSVGICYVLGIVTGAISTESPDFDFEAFQQFFFAGTIITWVVCAIFSTAYFFIRGKMKLVFLWAPVYVPLAYGLSVLFLPGAS
ncbi:MAG: hypothetical protein DHS20C02_12500 [Micavibrio sp.]|nr:MAG: hypothetical protein DHS20C02_12500 [Micavibrio sp.]